MKIQEIYTKQQDLFNSNITKDVSFRIEQLKKFRKILEENESELYTAIFEDFGKSEFETFVTKLLNEAVAPSVSSRLVAKASL